MASQILDAWRMSNEANLFLLKSLPAASLKDRYAPRTRTVSAQFAHIHGVRVRWLQYAAPTFIAGVKGFPRGAQPGKAEIRAALKQSADSVAGFLEECDRTGFVKNWNGPPVTFLGYLIAHEAHHRGLVLVAARMAGRRLPKELIYGLWDWGKKSSMR